MNIKIFAFALVQWDTRRKSTKTKGFLVEHLRAIENKNQEYEPVQIPTLTPTSTPTPNIQIPRPILHNKDLKWARNKDAIILIDMENVRGKTFFQASHRQMINDITLWTKLYHLQNKVSVIIDHGSEHTAYYLPEEKEGGAGISVVFAGPCQKADDILARDVSFFDRNVLVVTSDGNLMSRCRSTMERDNNKNFAIEFLKPLQFLQHLSQLKERLEREKFMLEKESTRDKTTIMSKRAIEKRSRMLCRHLSQTSQKNGHADVNSQSDDLALLEAASTYHRRFEVEDVLQWETGRRGKSGRRLKETTKDRVFLAEHLKKKIEELSMLSNTEFEKEGLEVVDNAVLRYTHYIREISVSRDL